MRARRDPEGRRRLIVEAACQLIAEVGVSALTHRQVAARADVPLGATTYYFASLRDLVTAALTYACDTADQELHGLDTELTASGDDLAYAVATLVVRSLSDRTRLVTGNELHLAAIRREELRTLARRRFEGRVKALSAYVPPASAQAAALLIDGAVLHALLHEEPLNAEDLSADLETLLYMHAAGAVARPLPLNEVAVIEEPVVPLGQGCMQTRALRRDCLPPVQPSAATGVPDRSAAGRPVQVRH